MFLTIVCILLTSLFIVLSFSKKPMNTRFALSLACTVFFSCAIAYAQDVVLASVDVVATNPSVTEPPAWLGDLLIFLSTIPTVGPILVEVLKWLGVIASAFTALSLAVQAILAIPMVIAKYAGATELAEKIKKLNEAIQPYLKYISIFNVQKKK